MGGILKERFVWNVDFVEGEVVNFKEQGFLKIFSKLWFFFVLLIKRRVFRWSKYRVVWCYLWSNS